MRLGHGSWHNQGKNSRLWHKFWSRRCRLSPGNRLFCFPQGHIGARCALGSVGLCPTALCRAPTGGLLCPRLSLRHGLVLFLHRICTNRATSLCLSAWWHGQKLAMQPRVRLQRLLRGRAWMCGCAAKGGADNVASRFRGHQSWHRWRLFGGHRCGWHLEGRKADYPHRTLP